MNIFLLFCFASGYLFEEGLHCCCCFPSVHRLVGVLRGAEQSRRHSAVLMPGELNCALLAPSAAQSFCLLQGKRCFENPMVMGWGIWSVTGQWKQFPYQVICRIKERGRTPLSCMFSSLEFVLHCLRWQKFPFEFVTKCQISWLLCIPASSVWNPFVVFYLPVPFTQDCSTVLCNCTHIAYTDTHIYTYNAIPSLWTLLPEL